MESLRKLIDIVEQGRLPAPMEPTYKKGPGGNLIPDIDVNLNPDMKSTQPRTPAPSTLPPLDAPMEPTYKKGPGGQLVPDIDYKLNPGMKPPGGSAPTTRPQPTAPRNLPKMPTVPRSGAGVKKVTESDFDQAVADIIKEINQQGVAEGGMPSLVIKHKKAIANMSDQDFANSDHYKKFNDDELRAMAWRHGYGKNSNHYVEKRLRGQKGVAEGSEPQLTVQQLATISDEALDKAYGYGRSTPGNSFGWQANLMSAAYAKKMIDAGVTDIEKISDAIHKGWNVTAQKFVQNPDQFDDTEKLRQAGKLEAKLAQREKLMKINYAQLDNEEQEKDRVVARALLQAIKGQQGVAEGKGSKPDYIDLDDDGDRKESMKKAASDRKRHAKSVQEARPSVNEPPPSIKGRAPVGNTPPSIKGRAPVGNTPPGIKGRAPVGGGDPNKNRNR